MSIFDSFAGRSLAPFLTGTLGEEVTILPKGGQGKAVRAIVKRDDLDTRGTDKNTVLEYSIEVQIDMADYPGAPGGGQPNRGGDRIELFARVGDKIKSVRTVATIIGQAGRLWRLGLE